MKPRNDRSLVTAVCHFVEAAVLANPAAYFAVIAVIIATALVLQLSQPIHHDAAWLLIATNRLLDNGDIYAGDIFDVNPPLILYLYAPAVLASRVFGVPEAAALRGTVLILGCGSLLLSSRALAVLFDSSRRQLRRALLVAMAYLGLVYIDLDLGQREHILWLLLLPYLVLAAARARATPVSTPLAVLSGIAGALAVSLKPPHLIALAAVEIIIVLRRRSLRTVVRPEVLAAVATAVLYLASVFAITPSYIDFVLPIAMDTYWVLAFPLAWIVLHEDLLLMGLALVAALVMRRDERVRDLAWVLFAAGAGFYVAMLMLHTGWLYHRIPYRCAWILLVSLAGFELASRLGDGADPPRGIPRFAGACAAAALTAALLTLQPNLEAKIRGGARWRSGETDGAIQQLVSIIDRHAANGSVFFLTSRMNPLPGFSYSQAQWASRFPSMWLLRPVVRARRGSPGVPPSFTQARALSLERYIRDSVVADLERYRPELIFYDLLTRNPVYGRAPFDVLAFFRKDPRFEKIWSQYGSTPQNFGFVAYVVRTPR